MKFIKHSLFILVFTLLVSSIAFAGSFEVFKVGDIKVVAIKDFSMQMEGSLLRNASEKVLKAYLPESGKCDASLNVFLVDNGKDVLLIDTGLGAHNGGKLADGLKNAGYSVNKITKVALTHLHGDHFGGLLDGKGNAVFKNAKIYVGQKELNFWLDKANNLTAVDNSVRGTFDGVEVFAKAYKGQIITSANDTEIIKGVKSKDAYGHTAGHLAYEIESGKNEMLIWGDVMHCLDVQINDPEVTLIYDFRPIQASETRKDILKDLAEDKIRAAGSHVPFPGVIEISRDVKGHYSYKKAN